MNLRFHWILPKAGELSIPTLNEVNRFRRGAHTRDWPARLPDVAGWTRFARAAETAGIDSLLVQFSRYEPESLQIACALGQSTEKINFLVAFRSGLMQPAVFVQQVNTLSLLTGGRVSLNMVAGSSKEEQEGFGDFLAHDDRYARADEFLQICRAFWKNPRNVNFEGKYYRVRGGRIDTPYSTADMNPDRDSPEIYISGHSEAAERLALRQGSCWIRALDTPEQLASIVERARDRGVEVCLRCAVVCRETRDEAVEFVECMLNDRDDRRRKQLKAEKNDSQMYREAAQLAGDSQWKSRTIWTGFVRDYGPIWTTLLGTFQEVAEAVLEYKRIGVTQFILSGWPELDAVTNFGETVIPLIRKAEC